MIVFLKSVNEEIEIKMGKIQHNYALIIGFTSTLLLMNNTFASEYKPFMKFNTFLYSESVSIDGALHNWRGDFNKKGNKQIGSIWLEAGVKKDSWLLSVLYREEYLLNYHPDTAELYNNLETTKVLDAGRRYHIDLEATRYKASGLRIAHDFTLLPDLTISLGSSLFQSSKLINGSLNGSASALSNQDYDYNINVDYYYDDDALFDRPNVKKPVGTGLSFDLASTWKANENVDVSLDIKDLVGIIRWKDAPFTRATATSDTKSFTPDGLVRIEPALQGIEGNDATYIQRLKPRGDLGIRYQSNNSNTSWLLQSKYYSSLALVGLGVGKPVKQGHASVILWPKAKTVEAKYRYRNINIALGIDDLNVSKANVFWLSLEIN